MKLATAILLFASAAAQRPALPEFIAGDQCLFCHRNDIGPKWQTNRHNLTVRMKEESTDEFTLGSRKIIRQLKKTGYGKFSIQEKDGTWNATKFADKCAGCHTTAVQADTKAFTEFGIDCYACHGTVDLEHTNDTTKILLSKKRPRDPKVITSICAQCHLRGASSKAKGFPYAYHFVAGDDVFKDFQVDWKLAEDTRLNAGDRHIYRNVKDVLEKGSETTCINCHAVHAASSDKHRRVLTNESCQDCHNATGPKKDVKRYEMKSATCEM